MIAPHPAIFAAAVVLAGSMQFDPQILTLEWPDGHRERIAATSPETCRTAVRAIALGLWRVERTGVAEEAAELVVASCAPGDGFAPGSEYIAGFNRPGDRR